jgi:hypothetical protein
MKEQAKRKEANKKTNKKEEQKTDIQRVYWTLIFCELSPVTHCNVD